MNQRLLVGALALIGLACGPTSQGTPPQAGTQEIPKPGGVLTLREDTDPFNWDISRQSSAPNTVQVVLAYNTLMNFKTGPDIPYQAGVIEPELAERWEVSPDAKTHTFYLRKGVKFANQPPLNGRELTSADVKWSLEYYTRSGELAGRRLPTSELGWMFPDFDRVEAPDPHTVKVHFSKPFSPFTNYAAARQIVILPKETYERENGFQDFILGSGPFQLDVNASQKGSRWVFNKNPDYFKQPEPYVDQLRFFILPEEPTTIAAFASKQLDLISFEIAQQGADEIRRLAPSAVLYEYEPNYPWTPYMNGRVRPFNDMRVRKAFSLSIDRDELIRAINRGRGSPEMPAVFRDYFTVEEVRQYQPYDPAEARRLLAEAGYPNGVDVETPYVGQTFGIEYMTVLQLMQAQLRKTGINLHFKEVDRGAFSSALRSETFQFILQIGANLRWDVDVAMSSYEPGSRRNYVGVNDPELTKLIEAQRVETDPAKRRELMRTASKLIAEKAYSLGLFSRVRYHGWHPHVKGHTPNANFGLRPWPAVIWLDR